MAPKDDDYAKAEHDFSQLLPNELPLSFGDIVFITQPIDSAWLEGILIRNGSKGRFPRDSVVQLVLSTKREPNKSVAVAIEDFKTVERGNVNFNKDAITVASTVIDDDWQEGELLGPNGPLAGTRGIYPKSFIIEVQKSTASKNGTTGGGKNTRTSRIADLRAKLEGEIDWNANEMKPKWEDLDIWSEEENMWSLKFPDLKLSKSDVQKQEVIYELYLTEKHHCQVIIILQQEYQVRLRKKRVVNSMELKYLIPDVLDDLLDFHLNLLRRIRHKQLQSPIVDTISDIISGEFESGDRCQATIDAYIRFCSRKEKAERMFVDLKARNANFARFFERYEADPDYKDRSFKSCLLLIAQRLSKYTLLMDKMHKCESAEYKELAMNAATAVRRFTSTVDNGLARIEIDRRWNRIQRMMDPSQYDDLVSFKDRKVLRIGTILWQNAAQKPEEVIMILFNDIIIFVIKKGGRYHFFSQDQHEPVISLKNLLIREVERSRTVRLIVLPPAKPDMYEIMFNTKQEMKQWLEAITDAHAHAQSSLKLALSTTAPPSVNIPSALRILTTIAQQPPIPPRRAQYANVRDEVEAKTKRNVGRSTFYEQQPPPVPPHGFPPPLSSVTLPTAAEVAKNVNDETGVEFYVTEFDFDADDRENQLSFVEGQLVALLAKHDQSGNDEWWLVEDEDGAYGYVPGSYLSPLSP